MLLEGCGHFVPEERPGGRRRRSTLAAMVVKINAIEVAEGRGPELEERFAARAREVDNQPGFLGFELLRPIKGETRYFVVTHWESDEDFQNWVKSAAFTRGHVQARADCDRAPSRTGPP